MTWWLVGAGAVIIAGRVLERLVPPPFWYVSARKRRGMRLALAAFAREWPNVQPVWPNSWVYRADPDKCFVFIQQRCNLHPPNYSGYVVWRDRDDPDPLGEWQFHWGILPRHAVEWYEARLAGAVAGRDE